LRHANGNEEAIRAGTAFVKYIRASNMRARRQSGGEKKRYDRKELISG
jgi:hypothetical protein